MKETYDKIKGHAVTQVEPDDKPLGFRTNDVPDPYAEGPQSDAEPAIPPLKYSDEAEHMPDGTEVRRLEIDDNVLLINSMVSVRPSTDVLRRLLERHLNTRVAKLEREVAELRAALAQSDALRKKSNA